MGEEQNKESATIALGKMVKFYIPFNTCMAFVISRYLRFIKVFTIYHVLHFNEHVFNGFLYLFPYVILAVKKTNRRGKIFKFNW